MAVDGCQVIRTLLIGHIVSHKVRMIEIGPVYLPFILLFIHNSREKENCEFFCRENKMLRIAVAALKYADIVEANM